MSKRCLGKYSIFSYITLQEDAYNKRMDNIQKQRYQKQQVRHACSFFFTAAIKPSFKWENFYFTISVLSKLYFFAFKCLFYTYQITFRLSVLFLSKYCPFWCTSCLLWSLCGWCTSFSYSDYSWFIDHLSIKFLRNLIFLTTFKKQRKWFFFLFCENNFSTYFSSSLVYPAHFFKAGAPNCTGSFELHI